jgi:hypothetical protein
MTFPDKADPWGVSELSLDELLTSYQDLPEDLVALDSLVCAVLAKTEE